MRAIDETTSQENWDDDNAETTTTHMNRNIEYNNENIESIAGAGAGAGDVRVMKDYDSSDDDFRISRRQGIDVNVNVEAGQTQVKATKMEEVLPTIENRNTDFESEFVSGKIYSM